MTLNKTLVAVAATLVTLGGSAMADGHEFNAATARLDLTLDTNGNGDVSDVEIIRGNMDVFDTDSNGAIDADERAEAEIMIDGAGM